MKTITAILGFVIFLFSCGDSSPSLKKGRDSTFKAKEFIGYWYRDTTYIPVYTNVYIENSSRKLGLTAIISIRNISLKDTIYIEDVNHYNSQGMLVKKYQENILRLDPLNSIEYVIKKSKGLKGDLKLGIGSSFVVNWGASSSKVRPIFQSVMVSSLGRVGVSFLTEGVSISDKK